MHRPGLVLVLLLALALPASAAAAPVPAGPRLASVTLRETPGSEKEERADPPLMALQTFGPRSAQIGSPLVGRPSKPARVAPAPFYGPSWSADGALLAFTGTAGERQRIYVVGADGSGLRAIPGTGDGADPVLSPDGHTIAFSRLRYQFDLNRRRPERSREFSSTTTWLADLGGGRPHRLTPWRDGLDYEPSSFSPDGSTLALTMRDRRLDGPRVVLMGIADGGLSELVRLGEEPAFSPDGASVAFVGYAGGDVVHAEEHQDYGAGDLYAIGVDRSGLRRLTRSDDVLESAPSWDPSGQRIAYVRARADTSFVPALGLLFPVGNSVMQVNADGSCASRVLSLPKTAFYGVSWQPGPGREAGPIAC